MDLKIVVRETKETDLLRYWQDLFAGFWQFSVVNSNWRLGESTVLPAHSVMVFGSDDTIEAIRAVTSHPVHGFGNWITLTIIHKSSWTDPRWIKDAFSLRQEGCMSTRLLVVWDDDGLGELSNVVLNIGSLAPSEQLHLAHSELDLALADYQLLPRSSKDDLVMAHKNFVPGSELSSYLNSRPLTLPVLCTTRHELDEIQTQITNNASFKLLSLDAKSKEVLKNLENVEIRDLGRANEAPWTGWHGMEPLFFSKD